MADVPFKKRPNARDVARHAGVSVATVSRVLNRAANVSGDTRQRVERAMEELRFVPSPAARAINSGRTRLVGALIPTLDHAIFARFIHSVEAALDSHGLSLVVATTNHDPERELDRAGKLLNIGAEGFIVSGITRADGFSELIARHDVPILATSNYEPSYQFPTIGYDNANATRMALMHLVDLGHREIAVLSGPSAESDRTRARLSGLNGVPGVSLYRRELAFSFEAAAKAVADLRESAPRITAVVCLSDVLAQGTLMYLRANGTPVPDSISVIGIDNLQDSASFDPPLTTVNLPSVRMGIAAADAIARWIEEDTLPDSKCLETELMIRGSTGPAPS